MSNLSNVWFKVTDLEVASGEGSWVTTPSGDRYLDFSGGIAVTSTGHSHPHVTAAIAAQAFIALCRPHWSQASVPACWPRKSTARVPCSSW